MNQILSIENSDKKNKRKSPLEVTTILRFYTIAILIFAIVMIGSGSYSMYKESKESLAKTKPTIYVEETTESQIKLKVTHNTNLSKVVYSWNEEEENSIFCTGKKNVEQVIEIPNGTNVLNVQVTDINGQETKYQKEYSLEGDITIDIDKDENNNVIITAKGKNELSYMTYRWDEEEEVKKDINNTSAEQQIAAIKGTHTLTIIVVDINNKTETKEMEIIGVTKPKLDVTTDGANNFIIKASDEEGLKKVEFIINETEKYMLNLDGRKELEYAYPLNDGENKLEVRVYNQNDIMETFKALVRKGQ